MKLFLGLFVRLLSAAPLAILLKLDLALDELLVFAAPIVGTLAFAAGEFYQSGLGHMVLNYPANYTRSCNTRQRYS